MNVNRQYGKKWKVILLASFGWESGVESASVGWNLGLHIWFLDGAALNSVLSARHLSMGVVRFSFLFFFPRSSLQI
jgi:hypothetical protein